MTDSAQELIIRRQKNGLLGTLVTAFFVALFCWVAVVLDTHSVLWALPCFIGLIGLWGLLRTPREILIRPQTSTIELLFRIDALAPRSKVFRFCDWSSIQSHIPIDDENQNVWLELRNDSGDRLVLDVSAPEVSDGGWNLTWDSYNEPEKTRLLREKVAAVTGVQDRGFRRPFGF